MEFWNMTPKDIMIDFKAYKKRNEHELQMAWISGVYFKKALESTVLRCGLVDKRVINNMPKYPEMPKTADEIESEKNDEAQTNYFLAKMRNWQMINNTYQRHKK